MRNDAIERSVNDSMLTIADSILQMIERTRKQQEIGIKRLAVGEGHSISNEKREEAEYELYYTLIKERNRDVFQIHGDCIDSFPFNQGKRLFQIFHHNGQFYGVYQQVSKEAHIVTQVYHSKGELLGNTFGTSKFERFRGHVFFLLNDGKAFSLENNQKLRLNLEKPFKPLAFYQNIEEARSLIVKDELKKDPTFRKQAFHRTLEEYYIPPDLIGKTVMLNSILKENEGVRVSFEENGKEQNIRLPDLDEKWMERITNNPRMKVTFDELIMGSRSIGEGFLAFYGLEINKGFHTRLHDFEVISGEEGSYIGKFNWTGKVKKLSPYFSEKEANEQLEKLNHYIQLEKQKDRDKDKEIEPSIKFMELSEKD